MIERGSYFPSSWHYFGEDVYDFDEMEWKSEGEGEAKGRSGARKRSLDVIADEKDDNAAP